MAKTHWKKFSNPDFLGAYAIEPDEDLIVTIKSVAQETFTGNAGKKEEGLIIRFEDGVKPMICNSTNAKMITKVLGTPYIEEWCGQRIAIGTATVNAFGDMVEALRVQSYKPKADIFCEDCGSPIVAAYGKSPKMMKAYTIEKYGRALCVNCAKAEAERMGASNEAD